MTTPGFRTVYIGATDEPGIHPERQIGHPDRQHGGNDFKVRNIAPALWTKAEISQLIKLWNEGISAEKIAYRFKRSEHSVRHKIEYLRQDGIALRPARPYRPRRFGVSA